MQHARRLKILAIAAAVAGIAVGCNRADTGTAADPLTTFATDLLRQLLAAFLL